MIKRFLMWLGFVKPGMAVKAKGLITITAKVYRAAEDKWYDLGRLN